MATTSLADTVLAYEPAIQLVDKKIDWLAARRKTGQVDVELSLRIGTRE